MSAWLLPQSCAGRLALASTPPPVKGTSPTDVDMASSSSASGTHIARYSPPQSMVRHPVLSSGGSWLRLLSPGPQTSSSNSSSPTARTRKACGAGVSSIYARPPLVISDRGPSPNPHPLLEPGTVARMQRKTRRIAGQRTRGDVAPTLEADTLTICELVVGDGARAHRWYASPPSSSRSSLRGISARGGRVISDAGI